MRAMVQDLIILDYNLSRQGFMEVLKQKKMNVNTANTPVIILAGQIGQNQLIELVPYNVKKIFNKPVKVDALLTTISEILGTALTIDKSPSIVDVHVNDSIIFIEIAKGLNRDKLDLLHFKLMELVELYEINIPKIIIMFSDMKLSFADAPNMTKLLGAVLKISKTKLHYVRVLTRDEFVRQFIRGKKEYSDIEVVANLQFAVEGLLAIADGGVGQTERKAEIIGDRILRAKTKDSGEAMALKFDAEARSASFELMKNSLNGCQVAVIDDDFIIHELINCTFRNTGAVVTTFSSGDDFISAVDNIKFDLAFLDLNMPGIDGFQVLTALQARSYRFPIIVLSANQQREAMLKAVQMGAKSYLMKPLKPEDIFRKSVEILKTSF